ncbi:tetratricopeptide repeat-containing sensor histidine kinase [Flavobacterium terrisoli]|uniref:tetratricopeptide repeat-containing sensor histidine kinase n=1 Tax=Flavobacterium terrisoli TaxID=3242195 RepID=UPI00254399D7|nr:tetratricopeptide repeat-containing sensor histidine kinase [Flavobacterium buctense]
MRNYFCGLLVLFSTFALGQKQTSIDSLLRTIPQLKEDSAKVNRYNKIAVHYSEIDSTKAFLYNKKALQLAEKIDWKEGITKSNFYLGTIYNTNFNYDKALVHFNKALVTGNQKLLAKTNLNIGCVYTYKSNFSKALDYFHRALKIDEKLGDKKEIAKIATNMGSVYYGIQNYKKALFYFNKAAKVNTETGNENDLAIINRNIGGVYNSLGQTQKALVFYEKAYQSSKKIKNESLQARILSDFALVYYNLDDFDKAIYYSQLSLKNKSVVDKQTLAFNHGLLGDAYVGKAKRNNNNQILLDSAASSLSKAIKLHQQLNSSRDLAYDFSSITQVYKLRGDYKKALTSYETAMVYEDSVFNFENKETIKNLEDKRAIELRDREIKIKKLQLESKERQKWMLVSGLALLGIIGGLLFYQSSNRRRVNKKLQNLNLDLEKKNIELDEANKIKARFFSILNHDLRSPVYNLIHFLHLQKNNPELMDAEMKISIEKKTVSSAENLLTSMEDMLLWSKSQMENFKPQPKKININTLFEDTQKHFSSEEKIKFSFENPNDFEITTDENYLKTIIRNLTGNAIKALGKTEHPTIVWKAWQEGTNSFLSITDNGSGASQEQLRALYDDKEVVGIKTGLGLHLIRDLAKAIDCTIVVDSKADVGTTFTLAL